jgi:hypothetical protein
MSDQPPWFGYDSATSSFRRHPIDRIPAGAFLKSVRAEVAPATARAVPLARSLRRPGSSMARVLAIPALCFLLGCGGGAAATGHVEIATTFVSGDNCPSITSAVAAPAETSVGGQISVAVTATDPDSGDTLTYAWTPAEGFENPHGTATSYTCTSAGTAALVVTVSDNHAPTPCTARATVAVRCVPP